MTQQPYELRLVLTPNQDSDTYTATLIEGTGNQSASFPFALPMTANDVNHMRWYLEDYSVVPGPGDHRRARNVEQRMHDLGERLFKAIFETAEGAVLHGNLRMARTNKQPCILTIGSNDALIHAQPWELMRDRQGPLLFHDVTIRRQLVQAGYTQPQQRQLPLRVLLIVSRPTDTGFIDPRNSIAPLYDVVDALPPGMVQLDFCEPPTFATLETMVSAAQREGRPYHMVHFDGHGTYSPDQGRGFLAFENDNETTDLIEGRALGDLLSGYAVPLVLLEACRTSDLSSTQPVIGSVAPYTGPNKLDTR